MKTITTTTDGEQDGTVRAMFTVLNDTAIRTKVNNTDGTLEETEYTYDNLVGIERLPISEVSARASYWHNVVNDLPNPPAAPAHVANWQLKAALEMNDTLPGVAAAINAKTGASGIAMRAAWNSDAPVARYSKTTTTIATALSLDSAQIDALFIQAAALNV